ncbi:hypothetical protein [Roseivirga thermotolerans]|nr:hypothetical protein [Roseivirga thermotolerans]
MLRIQVKHVAKEKKEEKIRVVVPLRSATTSPRLGEESSKISPAPVQASRHSREGGNLPTESTPDQVNAASLIQHFENKQADLKKQRSILSSSIFEMVFGHQEAPTIDIGSVLKQFDNTYDEDTQEVFEYEIMFLAMNQSSGNAYVREMRARKNVKSPKRQMVEKNKRGKQMYNLKYQGTMLLHDCHSKGTRSVKTRMIFAFRKPGEKLWCRVADRSGGWNGKPGMLKQVYKQEQLNDLYHRIDAFQPEIQGVFNKIRSLENTGKLPEQRRVGTARELDSLKLEKKRLNDKICKTKKKLRPSAKPPKADKVIQWQLELAEAEARRIEIDEKIKELMP